MIRPSGQPPAVFPHPKHSSLGIPRIDQEHLALLRTLDGLISRPDIQPHSSEFSEGFSILTRQLLEHFANEEAAMAAEGLSPAALEQHVSEHKQIIEQLTQLSFDLMARKPIPREHLVESMHDWIVGHFSAHDLELGRQGDPA